MKEIFDAVEGSKGGLIKFKFDFFKTKIIVFTSGCFKMYGASFRNIQDFSSEGYVCIDMYDFYRCFIAV